MLKKLLKNRKGTAEIIGSVMFIVILLFFFTNVYLWHDAATKEMNDLDVQKMNSGMEIKLQADGSLIVNDTGGIDVVLSRLWIDENASAGTQANHYYANLTALSQDPNVPGVQVLAGQSITIRFAIKTETISNILPQSVNVASLGNDVMVYYTQPATVSSVKFTIVNSLGVTSSTNS